MIRPEVDELVAFLNEALQIDETAISLLVGYRVTCNDSLRDHQSIQVGGTRADPAVGMIGLLNGFLGVYDSGPFAGCGPLCAVMDSDTGRLLRFARTGQVEGAKREETL